MTKISEAPQLHPVFNEFDRFGQLLGLPRLQGETNAIYKRRLMDVFVNRADSTYRGLLNGITRELGLSLIETMTITPILGGDGTPNLPQPAVVFQDTKVTLYSNFDELTVLTEFDRWELDGGAWTLQQLVDSINSTSFFTATLLPDAEPQKRSMTIFNQKSIITIASEDISGKGVRIHLDNNNLIDGTVSVVSPNLVRRVSTEQEIIQSGDYLVKLSEGIILAGGAPSPGSLIRYSYRNDNFIVKSSPVIIHNLQSSDFKTKMFDQVTDNKEEDVNGLPTPLGADIINELLSVFPSNWGT